MGCSSCSNNSSGVPNGCKSNGNCGVDGCGKLSVFNWLQNMNPASGTTPYNIVEVRFKNERKEYFRNVDNLQLHTGEIICVQGASGHDVGSVSLTGELVKMQLSKHKINDTRKLNIIYRKATESDIETWHEAREIEKELMPKARMLAIQEKLKMKISDIELQGDKSKATFYYTADTRVDFRELIKKFASEFKIRIEMKQIGARQEAAKLGGIGSCGRELCCSTWLTDFRSVSTSAARYQQLSLNPQALAGQCGKLKCCLNFELDAYMELMKSFPKNNVQLDTEMGRAKHMKTDVFKQVMWYAIRTEKGMGDFIPLKVKRVKEIIEMNKAGKKPQSLKDFMVTESIVEDLNHAKIDSQDSLTRFDKKFKKKKRRNNKNRNKGSNNNRNKQSANPQNNNKRNNPNKKNTKKSANPNNKNNPRTKQNNDKANANNPNFKGNKKKDGEK